MTSPRAIRIRRSMTADAAPLARFAARTFAETFGACNRPEDIAAHLAKWYGVPQQAAELADPDVITLVAERNEARAEGRDALVAYAQVRRNTPPPCVPHAGPVELRRFYVDRSAHGSGIAPRLMERVRSAARELGGRHLWLAVWEHNPRAIRFYAKQGFVDVGAIAFYVGPDRQNDRVMVGAVGDAGQGDGPEPAAPGAR